MLRVSNRLCSGTKITFILQCSDATQQLCFTQDPNNDNEFSCSFEVKYLTLCGTLQGLRFHPDLLKINYKTPEMSVINCQLYKSACQPQSSRLFWLNMISASSSCTYNYSRCFIGLLKVWLLSWRHRVPLCHMMSSGRTPATNHSPPSPDRTWHHLTLATSASSQKRHCYFSNPGWYTAGFYYYFWISFLFCDFILILDFFYFLSMKYVYNFFFCT